MHFLYILSSKTADRFYIGETKDVQQRLQDHIFHKYSKGFTKTANDWKIVLEVQLKNKEQAIFLEKFIKKMKSRKFIQKVIDDPEILNDILKNK